MCAAWNALAFPAILNDNALILPFGRLFNNKDYVPSGGKS